MIAVTLVAEAAYPSVYVWVWMSGKGEGRRKGE